MSEQGKTMQLTPDELVVYQGFYQAMGQAAMQLGQLTIQYQVSLEQAKTTVNQINQTRDSWVLKTLSKRGINPISGKWSIEPNTGNIINEAALHVVS